MEWLDIVDDEDQVVGRAARPDAHARGYNHRAVHVWLFNARRDVFVQRRSDAKDTFPGCHDSSASGHLDSGEDYDACAARELQEELGILTTAGQLQRLFKIHACEETGHEFVWVYRLQTDAVPVINTAEIQSGAFLSRSELAALVRDRAAQCAPSFCRIAREIFTRGLWP